MGFFGLSAIRKLLARGSIRLFGLPVVMPDAAMRGGSERRFALLGAWGQLPTWGSGLGVRGGLGPGALGTGTRPGARGRPGARVDELALALAPALAVGCWLLWL
jgi:hypothetical protein